MRVALTVLLLVGASALGATATKEIVGSRSRHVLGVDFAFLGDPPPSFWSIGVNYNALDYLRFRAGFGLTGGQAFAMGLSARVFVPGWQFSPFAGVALNRVAVSTQGDTFLGFYHGSTVFVSFPVGFEWQSADGPALGLAANLLVGNRETPVIPSLYFAFYH